MSWAGISATQWVSWANLQDAINTGYLPSTGTAIVSPSSTQWVNKPSVATYANILTSNSFYAAKATNQWVAKQDLTSNISGLPTGSLYSSVVGGHGIPAAGWSSGALACSGFGSGVANTVYYTGTFGNGTVIYQNSSGGGFLNTFSGLYFNTTDYYYFSGHYFQLTQTSAQIVAGTYAVSGYTSCVTMPFKVKNTNGTAKTAFTAILGGTNISSLTGITLTGSGTTTTGTCNNAVVGSNTVVLTDSSPAITVASSGAIVDAVTLSAVTYTVVSGSGTTTVTLSVTLTSTHLTNGILITLS